MAKRIPAAETPAETVPTTGNGYTVLARAYRPQQLGELVGQEPVAQALANALTSGRVAHAYLFTGARGVGKTSTARILAKALNCANGPTTTPCGVCDICRSITSGEDMDVLEIDGASNRGIDDVRAIRQNVQCRPARGRFKIYIIDEVHMLSKDAFNALLKTLEEPPAHVKFIFATTEVTKIPITILSRCQRFDFGGISLPRIVERLRQIVAGEGMQADDAALELVARRAGGSMRDAQSLLDQLLAFSADRLTPDTIHQMLGTAHEDRVAALANAVLQRDAKQAIDLLAAVVNEGQQLGELLDQLIEYWRDLMVVRCAGADGQDLSVSGAHRIALQTQAEGQGLDTVLAGLDLLVAAKTRMSRTSHARVILEMTLVRLSQLEDLVPLAQLAEWASREADAPSRAARKPVAGSTQPTKLLATASVAADAEKKKLVSATDAKAPAVTVELRDDTIATIWQQVVALAGFALSSDLRKVASLAISGPNTLALRVSQRYNIPGTGIFDPAKLARVETLVGQVVGHRCMVRTVVIPDETPAGGTANSNGPAAPPGGARQLREKAKQLPFVQKAREVLGAEIIHVDPDFGEVAAPARVPDDVDGVPAEEG